MSNLRQRMLVTVDGTEHQVTTNARDLAAVEKYADPKLGEPATLMGMRIAHAALLRTGVDVPADFDAFLDVLDNVTDLDGDIDPPGPTQPAAGVNSQ